MMQPTMCSRCGKNVAVIFITKLEGGTSKNEGLCLKCAREMGIKPIDDMMKKMGISDEDLESISTEMMSAFGGAEEPEGMVPSDQDGAGGDGEEGEGGLNHTTQDININHMITLIDKGLVYDPKDMDPDAIGKNLFTGSFNDMFSNMMGVQAKDSKATNIALNNDYTTLVALDSSREGVSGVDLNDEAMNMMQYQKAMNAAMRLMTAIDEALDRLINNTGMAGR